MIVGIHGDQRGGKGTCARALFALGTWQQVDFADALRRALVKCLGDVEVYGPDGEQVYVPIREAAWRDECKSYMVDIRSDEGDYLIRCAATVGADVGGEVAYDFACWLREERRTVRAVLQRLGTEVYRAKNPNYWVDEWERRRYAIATSTRGATYHKVTGYCDLGGRVDATNVVATDVRFINEAHAIRSRGGAVVRLDTPWARPSKDGIAGHSSDARLPDELVDVVVPLPPRDDFPAYEDWAAVAQGAFMRALEECT